MIVEKQWGYEEYLANQETYTGKRLHIFLNRISSVHCHIDKTETFLCESGLVHIVTYLVQLVDIDVLILNPNPTILTPGNSITITPGTWHSFYSGTTATIIEFSDKHSDLDVYRLAPSGAMSYPPNLKKDVLVADTDWEKYKKVLDSKSI
jgi:D-lyxose ketol-isomerase